jgi:uncharacterized membrane protein
MSSNANNAGVSTSPTWNYVKTNPLFIFSVVGAVSLFMISFVELSKFAGSSDNWNQIKPQVQKVILLTIFGTIALTIAALFYFVQDPQKTMYFVLVISCLSLGLSYAALGVAAISR